MANSKLKIAVGKNDHIQGGPDVAQMTLVEYGDYQCPYCGAAYPVVKGLQKYFGRDLRFVFRNFPLSQAHPYAVTAAVSAEAAALQSKFWEMHDTLFENQVRLKGEDILRYAMNLELDLKKFDLDMRSQKLLDRVRMDYVGGEESGVEGTPTFYMNGFKYIGAHEYSDMKRHIESLLHQPTASI